jgi:hypothetical protein
MARLKKLLEDIAFENDIPKVNKHKVIESVSVYGQIGKGLYNNNITEMAQGLIKIAEDARHHVLSETDDWFDKVSVSRNMKSVKEMVKEFKKTAIEYNSLNQRLTVLYEDVGSILNRYYDIREETGDKSEYTAFFNKAAEKFGFDPEEINTLPDDKKKEFFNYVDKNWSGDNEAD